MNKRIMFILLVLMCLVVSAINVNAQTEEPSENLLQSLAAELGVEADQLREAFVKVLGGTISQRAEELQQRIERFRQPLVNRQKALQLRQRALMAPRMMGGMISAPRRMQLRVLQPAMPAQNRLRSQRLQGLRF